MNRENLLTYVRPLLRAFGLYAGAYRIYFWILSVKKWLYNCHTKLFSSPATILLYHRIDTVGQDPLKLCVPSACFERHLQFLTKHYEVLTLEKLAAKVSTKTLAGNEAAITFDDGYRDNLIHALPLLEKYNVPATIFIVTSQMGQRASFPWDKQYQEKDRAVFLSESEIRELARHPLITIGAHTHNHSRLSELSFTEQQYEVMKGKEILEQIISKPVTVFAYPFGGTYDFTADSKHATAEAAFEIACTNTGEVATEDSDLLTLPRINIRAYSILRLAFTLGDLSHLLGRAEAEFVSSSDHSCADHAPHH